jgi:hypothetical protein
MSGDDGHCVVYKRADAATSSAAEGWVAVAAGWPRQSMAAGISRFRLWGRRVGGSGFGVVGSGVLRRRDVLAVNW